MNRPLSGAAGQAQTFQQQLKQIQAAIDRHRQAKEGYDQESAIFLKEIQEAKVQRHQDTLEKQSLQEAVARFNYETKYQADTKERLIRQKEEDKQALIEAAAAWKKNEEQEKANKLKFCEEMRKKTEEHERLLRRMEMLRLKKLVCPETAAFLVSNLPKEATEGGAFTPEIGQRLKMANDKLKHATEAREEQHAIYERLLVQLKACREQVLSNGQGLTMSQICHQEELWARGTGDSARGRASQYDDTTPPKNHLDMFYGHDSNSSLMEEEEEDIGGASMNRSNDGGNYSAGGEISTRTMMGFGGESDMMHYGH